MDNSAAPQPAPPLKYYSSLAPFRAYFRAGTPILMYHKVGPRPRGAVMKFLYVSPALFARQMAELRAAHYASVPLEGVRNAAERSIAITFDDGFRNVLRHALAPLAEAKFRAIQFIVADRIGRSNEWDLPAGEAPEPLMDKAEIADWLAAGHAIGAHTLTHPNLRRIPREQAREEIAASGKRLEDLFGVPIRHFCYPYGARDKALEELVQEAGYETACTTEPGINSPGTPPLGLKRFTARYASRNPRDMLARLFVRWR